MLPTLLLKNYVHLQFQLSRNTASNVQVLSPISLINFRIFRKRCRYVRQIWISFPYCKYDILIHACLSLRLIMIWQYLVLCVQWRFKITSSWNTINLLYVYFEIDTDIYDSHYTCINTCKPVIFRKTLYKDIHYPDTCIFTH